MVVLQRLLEVSDALTVGAGHHPPVQKVSTRREFDVRVTQLGRQAADVGQRQVAVHVGVEGDLHSGSFYWLMVCCKALMEVSTPASIDMVRSSISSET